MGVILAKKIQEFEKETGIKLEELDRRYYERKRLYEEFLKSEVKKEKTAPGMWRVVCFNCNELFVVKQYNYKYVPKLCPKCKESGVTCLICGTPIPFGRYICKSCRKWLDILPNVREGHMRQAEKMKGDKNPARHPEVREEVNQGLKLSDESNMSSLEKLVASTLIELGVPYTYEPRADYGDGRYRFPDFVIANDLAIEVVGFTLDEESIDYYLEKIRDYLKKFKYVIVVTYTSKVAALFEEFKNEVDEYGLNRVVAVSLPTQEHYVEIGVDNVTNIDYGHWLGFHEGKCSQIHYHTSWNVSIRVGGYVWSTKQMLIDYADLKKVVKEVVNEIDHKLLVHEKFIVEDHGYILGIAYDTDKFRRLYLPRDEVHVIDFEPTAENIVKYLATKIMERMPENITKVELTFREGTNNVAWGQVRRPLREFECLKKIICFYYELLVGEEEYRKTNCECTFAKEIEKAKQQLRELSIDIDSILQKTKR